MRTLLRDMGGGMESSAALVLTSRDIPAPVPVEPEEPSLLGRKILFLQGPSSLFFARCASEAVALGATVMRLGFAPGDWLYWNHRAGPCRLYTGDMTSFSAWFAALLLRENPTDVVMLGDGRPCHQEALQVLSKTRITPWIVEQGYLRGGLIAIETHGHGGRSLIPMRFARAAAFLPRPQPAEQPASASFLRYGALDLGYHLANLTLSWLITPRYRHHALDGPVREYVGWLGKALRWPWRRRAHMWVAARINAPCGSIFLLPLQLPTDYQLRHHGTGETMEQVLGRVIGSFARHAGKSALLVVKDHPLDNGWTDWEALTLRLAHSEGVGDRVVHLPQGDAGTLLPRASGVVTVNSSVGLTAIQQGVPCLALGRAIYARPGLTAQTSLDFFWRAPERPDPALTERFCSFLRAEHHLHGSFDGPGARFGGRNLARYLAAPPRELGR